MNLPTRAALASLMLCGAWATSAPALAQTPAPGPATSLSPAEKAQREAERVFDVIRFHTVKTKAPRPPAVVANATPPTPRAAAVAAKPAAAGAPTVAARTTAPASDALAASGADISPAAAPGTTPGTANAALAAAPLMDTPSAPPSAPALAPAPSAAADAVEPGNASAADDGTGRDTADEVPLTLQAFVAPVLTPELQATLGAGSRHVKVRVTVEPDGRVSRADAAAGVPRRLARPATEAVMQWQFTPLAEARTADVDLVFRRD